jgi:hypothetical protein
LPLLPEPEEEEGEKGGEEGMKEEEGEATARFRSFDSRCIAQQCFRLPLELIFLRTHSNELQGHSSLLRAFIE